MLIVQRCEVEDLEDLIVRCGRDNSTSLAWGSLVELDLSNNVVTKLGNSLVSGVCVRYVKSWNRKFHGAGPIQTAHHLAKPLLCERHSLVYGKWRVLY